MTLRNQGVILGEDSEKMSKSRGNVIAPDALVNQYGADAVRAYLMFFARWDQGAPWSGNGIEGVSRWLQRVWRIVMESLDNREASEIDQHDVRDLHRKVHQTIKQISHDMEHFQFNTVISALMELTNALSKAVSDNLTNTDEFGHGLETLLKLMAPVTPHITEELWSKLNNSYSIHQQSWPVVDDEAVLEEEITLVVQVNGKVRERLVVPANIDAEDAKSQALNSENVQRYLDGKEPLKVIYVAGRLDNIVV